MKKLLLACNGCHFPHGAFEFALSMNLHEKILLKGMFMPSVDYSRMTSLAYDGEGPGMAAIRAFSSLMTYYGGLPLTVSFCSDSKDGRLSYEKNITEYIQCHYKQFNIQIPDNQSAKDLDEWVGAYKKSFNNHRILFT